MFDIIPLVIIIFCLIVIAVIVVRKFPQAANLDLDSMPEEKIYRTKRNIINKRIEQSSALVREKIISSLSPLSRFWRRLQLQFRIYVGKIERLLHHEQVLKNKQEIKKITVEEKEEKIAQILGEAQQGLQAGNYDRAEDGFIAAIKIDPKSILAYRGLGDTYFAKESLEEAKQTYKFLLHMDPKDDSVMVRLAETAEAQGNWEEAIQYYQQAILVNDSFSPRFYRLAEAFLKVDQPEPAKEAALQAVDLEPQNPKYLDLLIEIAIICGDKAFALKTYNDLRLVNPENQKLDNFKDRIYKIGGTP
jgi:tetratricopeptide (TPR) repeat protein